LHGHESRHVGPQRVQAQIGGVVTEEAHPAFNADIARTRASTHARMP
jgi:hypothetical protein